MTKALAFLIGMMTLFAWQPALNAQGDELYTGRTIVTGQEKPSRLTGFATCLTDVLVKLSGDPRLLTDARVAKLASGASDYVSGFTYRDRLEGIPIHDEQGTRDRPFDLTVTFEKDKIDDALKSLGSQPWLKERPRLATFIAVRLDQVTYLLALDGARGIDQRESLAAAAWQAGMPIVLPSEAMLKEAGLTVASLQNASDEAFKGLIATLDADVAVVGTLIWDKNSLGWAADWRLVLPDRNPEWRIRDVNFDDAFRSAVRGAAQVLSGNGDPGG